MLADLGTELEAATFLRWTPQSSDLRSSRAVRESSQAKLYATEKMTHICGACPVPTTATRNSRDQNFFASCKALEIGSGAPEMHRNNIAQELPCEFDTRFESGELMRWGDTNLQGYFLMVNDRSPQVLEKLGRAPGSSAA